ncbi:MAG: DinB family protein [Chitinophagaceae bacterium]
MKKRILLLTLCLPFLASYVCHAQSLADVKAQMGKDWERAKSYTVDYLNTMPADKYSFKATDSIRSFAQQMLHLAQANIFLMSNATDQQPPAWLMSNPENSKTAQQKDSVMYYVTSSYDFCMTGVKNSEISKWWEKKKIFGFEETRFALMNKTFEHQTHHRGQATIYIRLQGIKPPQERLF